MITDVESKIFESGVLRSIGMAKINIIQILGYKSFCFSIPALLLAISMAHILNIPIAIQIANFITADPTYTLGAEALVIGCCFGILIPFFSSIIPMRHALSTTLRDALDLYHNAADDVVVTIKRV